jgi:hypothetical protein
LDYDKYMMMSTTTKVLLASLSMLILVSGIVAYKVFFPSKSSNPSLTESSLNSITSSGFVASPSATVDERLKNLEYAVGNLVTDIKSTGTGLGTTKTTTTTTALETRVKTLETSLLDIQARLKTLEANKTTTTTSSSSKSDSFIPLNWTGTTTSTDWTSITSQVISVNPADYSGYTAMKFEVQMKLDSTGGRGYARLFNQDDNSVITLSEASTDQSTTTWTSSGSFTLPSARKSYYLQIKSTTNYQTSVENAQLRVIY